MSVDYETVVVDVYVIGSADIQYGMRVASVLIINSSIVILGILHLLTGLTVLVDVSELVHILVIHSHKGSLIILKPMEHAVVVSYHEHWLSVVLRQILIDHLVLVSGVHHSHWLPLLVRRS